MANMELQMNPQMEQIHGEIRDTMRALAEANVFWPVLLWIPLLGIPAPDGFNKNLDRLYVLDVLNECSAHEAIKVCWRKDIHVTEKVYSISDVVCNQEYLDVIYNCLSQNGFQKLDKIKDSSRQSKQLEELTGKMRECKRLIKEFDREIKDEESRNPPEVTKELNDVKQNVIKELNSYVALRKTYTSTLGNKRVELFDMGAGASEPTADENVQMASEMSNQELINAGTKTMDETDQAIERSKQVVHQTVEVGTTTATTLKGQTEQMGRIVNELDTIQFSIKKASQLVKEIGRQVATDKCIMLFLFLIVCGVIAIIVVKIVNPSNKSIRDVPGLAPPAPPTRRLLYAKTGQHFY